MLAKQHVLWAIAILVGLGIASYRSNSVEAQQGAPPLATRWEYKMVSKSQGSLGDAEALGEKGWELVAVTVNDDGRARTREYMYFKRPR